MMASRGDWSHGEGMLLTAYIKLRISIIDKRQRCYKEESTLDLTGMEPSTLCLIPKPSYLKVSSPISWNITASFSEIHPKQMAVHFGGMRP
jgi:hypothetical protein